EFFRLRCPLYNLVELVSVEAAHRLPSSRRPADFDLLDVCLFSKPKMNSYAALRCKSISPIYKTQIRLATCLEADLRAHTGPIRFRPLQQERNPVIFSWRCVPIENRRRVGISDGQVKPAIIIKIGHGNAPSVQDGIQTVSSGLFGKHLAALAVKE